MRKVANNGRLSKVDRCLMVTKMVDDKYLSIDGTLLPLDAQPYDA